MMKHSIPTVPVLIPTVLQMQAFVNMLYAYAHKSPLPKELLDVAIDSMWTQIQMDQSLNGYAGELQVWSEKQARET
jgi:hypothetical protein